MSSEKAWNMFVFRDGRRTVSGATLARDLAAAFDGLSSTPQQDSLISALLRAGELECALTDAGSPSAENVAVITDELAGRLLGGTAALSSEQLSELVPPDPPLQLKISPPEGFAYYALHPLDFSDMGFNVPIESGRACVVGIRSIGTTLSALVAAALRLRQIAVTRVTVRPQGHPYDRRTVLDPRQLKTVSALNAQRARFMVVDEGPGMSGSSFLSVGDCLTEAGVSRENVLFMCSRVPDPDSLRADNAGERWRSYSSMYANKNSRLPQDATVYLGGGDWRKAFLLDEQSWPASWTQMERLKFLSSDRRQLFKFEGFGRFGEAVHERAVRIAEAGFGPRPLGFSNGFSAYPVVAGRCLSEQDLCPELIDRLAEYCAFRYREFASDPRAQDTEQLESMVQFNVHEEFGMESPIEPGSLNSLHPVVVDGRMMPYEWIGTARGEYLKVDGASHGDDHFFPGPTDIAWDLAGAVIEWNMNDSTAGRLLSRYQNLSGDDAEKRLPAFLWAYGVFRMGYCSMAAAVTHEPMEHDRLMRAYWRYRLRVNQKSKLDSLSLSLQ